MFMSTNNLYYGTSNASYTVLVVKHVGVSNVFMELRMKTVPEFQIMFKFIGRYTVLQSYVPNPV